MNIEERLKQREEELKIMYEVADIINSNLALEDILNSIVDLSVRYTNADSCFVYLYDEDEDALIMKASKNPRPGAIGKVRLDIGEGITGWVAEKKQPVKLKSKAYEDPRFKGFPELPEEAYESFLSIAVVSKEELIGVINLQNKKEYEFSGSQVDFLSRVAGFLGGAVKNAVMQGEFQRKKEQLDILSRISRTIVSDNYLNEILQLIVILTAQLLNSKICSIMLLDEKKNELVIAATQSLSNNYKDKPPVKVGQSISGKAVLEKRVIAVSDVTDNRDYMYPGIARKEGIVSMLAAPMIIKGRVIGVINSYTAKKHDFTAEEIRILHSVAGQAAVAIENTRLSDEILKAREEIETRKIIEKAKGVIMKNSAITEEEAYKALRKKSMDLRKSMKEIAEAVIIAADMKSS